MAFAPDVAISTGAGRIKPSTILRWLATYSRKSKLYFAFREVAHAVRTGFLLLTVIWVLKLVARK